MITLGDRTAPDDAEPKSRAAGAPRMACRKIKSPDEATTPLVGVVRGPVHIVDMFPTLAGLSGSPAGGPQAARWPGHVAQP